MRDSRDSVHGPLRELSFEPDNLRYLRGPQEGKVLYNLPSQFTLPPLSAAVYVDCNYWPTRRILHKPPLSVVQTMCGTISAGAKSTQTYARYTLAHLEFDHCASEASDPPAGR